MIKPEMPKCSECGCRTFNVERTATTLKLTCPNCGMQRVYFVECWL